MQQSLTIPEGFGQRLRTERERVGLNQSNFAGIGGVKRLAQSQYEKEINHPTVKYLALIAATGVNLEYVLFGKELTIDSLGAEEKFRIESEAFRQLEAFVNSQPGKQMGAEGRFAVFQLFRANLISAAAGDSAASTVN